MRVVVADIKGGDGFISKDTVAGGYGSRLRPFSKVTRVASALKLKKKDHKFAHGARHEAHGLVIVASYHCSRYNTNTGVLTEAMFDAAVKAAKDAAGL